MSEDKERLDFDIIDPDEIIVLCEYGWGRNAYPHMIKEAQDLFSRVIPLKKRQFDDGTETSIFYPMDELRIKRAAPKLYKGDKRKRVQENGMGYYYHHMGIISELGKNIKQLHNVLGHNIDRLKVFARCKVIWGEEDRDISSSIHKVKPFHELKDWKDIKISKDIEKKSQEIVEERARKAIAGD